MMVSNLDYDQHKGRLAIGRVTSGSLKRGQTVAMAKPGARPLASSILPEGSLCSVTGCRRSSGEGIVTYVHQSRRDRSAEAATDCALIFAVVILMQISTVHCKTVQLQCILHFSIEALRAVFRRVWLPP